MPTLQPNQDHIKSTLRAEAIENGVEVTEHEIDIACRLQIYMAEKKINKYLGDLSTVAADCNMTVEDIERCIKLGDEISAAWKKRNGVKR